jgi:DNA-binding HxlR family transcriptional regulator
VEPPDETFCPSFHHAVELVGRRWTGVVLRALLRGITRFGDLRAAVPGLSDRMLTERLRELQDEGIVERRVYPETPVRVEYTLTAKGNELQTVVDALVEWAEKWVVGEGELVD